MLHLYQAGDVLEAQLLAAHLDQHGVKARVTGWYLQGGVGELPADLRPSVWVLRAWQFSLARQLLADFLAADTVLQDDWRCPRCGAEVAAELALCWRCGACEGENR